MYSAAGQSPFQAAHQSLPGAKHAAAIVFSAQQQSFLWLLLKLLRDCTAA
jgi:hypothetical protein